VADSSQLDADVIVVGAGLAGLVATAELADTGRTVVLVDQEGEQSLGGQAWWSLGGLFLVDSPEQRRLRGRTGSARRASIVPRTSGRADGRRHMCISRPEKNARGCTRWVIGSFPSLGGPSEAVTRQTDTATRCLDFT
jgi:glycine/D-amino acid oxidase-like deaminating enzyme